MFEVSVYFLHSFTVLHLSSVFLRACLASGLYLRAESRVETQETLRQRGLTTKVPSQNQTMDVAVMWYAAHK